MEQVQGQPFRKEVVDSTRWDWSKGFGLWDSVTGSDASNGRVGFSGDSARQFCPIVENLWKYSQFQHLTMFTNAHLSDHVHDHMTSRQHHKTVVALP